MVAPGRDARLDDSDDSAFARLFPDATRAGTLVVDVPAIGVLAARICSPRRARDCDHGMDGDQEGPCEHPGGEA